MRLPVTLPVSVTSVERSSSKLKLLKNYIRSTMSQERPKLELEFESKKRRVLNS